MEALMNRSVVTEIVSHFQALSCVIPLHAIRNESDYDKAVDAMNQRFDAGAADEQDPLADLVKTLGALISDYDDVQHAAQDVQPSAMLRFLVD